MRDVLGELLVPIPRKRDREHITVLGVKCRRMRPHAAGEAPKTTPAPTPAAKPAAKPAPAGLPIVDLFCGAGGFSTGACLKNHAWVAVAIDCNGRALNVYRRHHRGALVLERVLGEDVVTTAQELRALLRKLGIIDFHLHMSPPCKRVSQCACGRGGGGARARVRARACARARGRPRF